MRHLETRRRIRVMRAARQTVFVLVGGTLFALHMAGCGPQCKTRLHSTAASTERDKCVTVDEIRKFLPLGTPLSVIEPRFPNYDKTGWMVHSSQLAPGGTVHVSARIELGFAVDGNGHVFYLTSGSPEICLPGSLRIGDSFDVARRAFPAEEIFKIPGYGTLMRVAPEIWLLFDDTIGPRGKECKILAVEIRNDLK